MAIYADAKRNAYIVCDFCEKRVYQHVCIGVRTLGRRGWGFFEGHQRCWPLERRKLRKPLKSGTLTRYNYR